MTETSGHPVETPLLAVRDLVKRYGQRTVVDKVSYDVMPGEIVGLLGPNGAGKTTSFRITIGMIDANGGEVWFDGANVSRLPMYKRARLGMGYLAQEPSVFQRLTIFDNLMAILETRSDLRSKTARREVALQLIQQFGLEHKINEKANTCSGGERRKLEIARALTTNPKLILLDEPFSNVDPIAKEDLRQQIFALKQRGISMLITDHDAPQMLRTCDRAYLIIEGHVQFQGTPRELIANEQARKKYFGQTTEASL